MMPLLLLTMAASLYASYVPFFHIIPQPDGIKQFNNYSEVSYQEYKQGEVVVCSKYQKLKRTYSGHKCPDGTSTTRFADIEAEEHFLAHHAQYHGTERAEKNPWIYSIIQKQKNLWCYKNELEIWIVDKSDPKKYRAYRFDTISQKYSGQILDMFPENPTEYVSQATNIDDEKASQKTFEQLKKNFLRAPLF